MLVCCPEDPVAEILQKQRSQNFPSWEQKTGEHGRQPRLATHGLVSSSYKLIHLSHIKPKRPSPCCKAHHAEQVKGKGLGAQTGSMEQTVKRTRLQWLL